MPEIKELCFEMLAKICLMKSKTSSKSVGTAKLYLAIKLNILEK